MFVKKSSFSPTHLIKGTSVHIDDRIFRQILEPKGAVEYLRYLADHTHASEPFNWGLIEEITILHFEGWLLNLKLQFKIRNSAAIAVSLEEKAMELTLELPFKMTDRELLSATEAERLAYQITLMRMLALAVRALHGEQSAQVKF